MNKRSHDYYRGCLIGGAIGDALGWPVEFKDTDEILREYGDGGIQDLVLGADGKAEITDDTQMTLFTAEGILRANTRFIRRGICHPPAVIYGAYLRWLRTQEPARRNSDKDTPDGWLIRNKELHAARAPGRSCITALKSEVLGTIESPINDSKGCGGVMRMAPVGLAYRKEGALKAGAEYAAMTHGHPSGYLSAGALAYVIACIIEGQDIEKAFHNTLLELQQYKGHEECSDLLKKAIQLVHSDVSDLDGIEHLGGGWVGDEALAISAYCALKYRDDFKKALIVSVNHDGDSDSTGSITGNILGAYLGMNNIPVYWLKNVELRDVIIQVADDLLIGHQEGEAWWDRYPGH